MLSGQNQSTNLMWFAVQTRHHHEKRVAARLQAGETETFLPVHCAVHRWRNGVQAQVETPLFPSYLFARFRSAERMQVLRDPGVLSLAASSASPTPIRDEEILLLRQVAETVKVEPHPYMAIGERVRITAGPLTGLEGFLARKKQDLRVVVSVEAIMRSVAIEISEFDIEPVQSRS